MVGMSKLISFAGLYIYPKTIKKKRPE